MGIFSITGLPENQSQSLVSDAIAITTYTYHNLDQGFAYGYQKHGIGAGLPITISNALLGNTHAQGVVPGLPWNPDSEALAKEQLGQAGWTVIGAEALGYDGKVDRHGTFFGESKGYESAQAEVIGKYDDSGKLIQIGIAFRGTSAPREILLGDTLGDIKHILGITFRAESYSSHFVENAFGNLLESVASFAAANGLNGQDVLFSGHSLGGMMVNSVASQSESLWGGFFSDAHYISFATPIEYEVGQKVLNIGFENDPVFRTLDGTDFKLSTLLTHDKNYESTTDNIVSFNDYYASGVWNLLPFGLFNLPSWLTHLPFLYEQGVTSIMESAFYPLTEKDSTVIVSALSDAKRGSTWVTDLNRDAQKHEGPTFILGSDKDDLIKGGKGNDYLEGRGGNDIFRDEGGFNIILGGDGHNTLDLQHALNASEIAKDGDTLYLRDQSGGITIASDIDTIRSKESFMWVFNQRVDHKVSEYGLLSSKGYTAYATSVHGDANNNTLTGETGAWLFGQDGDDVLMGSGNNTFVGGAGNDELQGAGKNNTYLFSGRFGHDTLYHFDQSDTLIFMGVEGALTGNYRDFLSTEGDNLVLNFGESSVTLVGVEASQLNNSHIVLA
ncbi:polyurethanase [Paramixta manurensis]|uniref:Polyurethanase n=1 Tax=Paramixta manurensis TaxID=2740817 RepID=A0A6M8UDY1_9GAMM|nr:polyurethanase [Erwiniaceae bacterium PD-1]